MERRDLFKVAGIGAAAMALSGCTATMAGSALGGITSRSASDLYPKGDKKRLVVLGGGIGGMSIASIINEQHGDEIEVIVLEQNSRFHACPGSNILLSKTASEYVKEASATSTWVFDYNKKQSEYNIITNCTVVGGDIKNKVLYTTQGNIAYDTLVVASGITHDAKSQFPTWSQTKLRRLKYETPSAMMADAGEEWSIMSERWEKLVKDAKQNPTKGYVIVLNATPKTNLTGGKTLRRCPPAAGERTTVLASRIKKEGLNNLKIKYITELDGSLGSKHGAFKQSWEDLGYCKDILKPTASDIIEPIFNARIKDVDFDKKIITYEQKKLNEDLEVVGSSMKAMQYSEAIIMVYQATPAIVTTLFGADPKLGAASFECEKFKDHFMLGDNQTTHKLPPSGSMAMSIAGIMAGEVYGSLTGKKIAVDYTKASNTCFSLVGENPNEAISVSHTFIVSKGIIKGKGKVPKNAQGIYRDASIAESQSAWIYSIGALYGNFGTVEEGGVLNS